jgi:hypothetical protein
VSPLVWQQLGQRKGGELGVASSKTDESHADQEVSIRLCCATYDEADEEEDIATYDEPSAPKKIAVCSADHESDGDSQSVDGDVEALGARISELRRNNAHTGGKTGHNPE